MWYIFPQLKGLGRSSTAQFYGLDGMEEARRFADDPFLGGNLRTITQALLDQPDRNARSVFGGTDAMKLRSCMTLFYLVSKEQVFMDVLEKFYGGAMDMATINELA